jgi:hypothetical protein
MKATGYADATRVVIRSLRQDEGLWPAVGHDPRTDRADDMGQLKALKDENARLRKLVADLSLDLALLRDVIGQGL